MGVYPVRLDNCFISFFQGLNISAWDFHCLGAPSPHFRQYWKLKHLELLCGRHSHASRLHRHHTSAGRNSACCIQPICKVHYEKQDSGVSSSHTHNYNSMMDCSKSGRTLHSSSTSLKPHASAKSDLVLTTNRVPKQVHDVLDFSRLKAANCSLNVSEPIAVIVQQAIRGMRRLHTAY